MKKAAAFALLALPSLSAGAEAKTINVPADTPFIAAAVSMAQSGDEVVVAPGTYHEDWIVTKGKAITIRGKDPMSWGTIEKTVVRGQGDGPVFIFSGGEGPDTVLEGLTITGAGGKGSLAAGITALSASPTLRNCLVRDNQSPGIQLNDSDAMIEGCRVSRNSAKIGGGIYAYRGSSPTIDYCTISGNVATGIGGGGVAAYLGSETTILRSVITGNEALEADAALGGGLWCGSRSSALLVNSLISGNRALIGGGVASGVAPSSSYASPATVDMLDCVIRGNVALAHGGGFYAGPQSDGFIDRTEILSNHAAHDGGALHALDLAQPVFSACTFAGNSADGDGGALATEGCSPRFESCLLVDNHARGRGGALHALEGSPRLTHCSLTGNEAESGGALCSATGAHPKVYSSILWRDLPDEVALEGGNASIHYSDVKGGFFGIGNIDLDPNWFSTGEHAMLLHKASPCIDAGAPWSKDSVDWTQDGPWFAGANTDASDMGVYGGGEAWLWFSE